MEKEIFPESESESKKGFFRSRESESELKNICSTPSVA